MNRFNSVLTDHSLIAGGMMLFTAAVLSGCGESQLPSGAELRIFPASSSIVIPDRTDANGFCILDSSSFIDRPVVLSMVDSAGLPLGDVSVRVYVDWSGNTAPGPPALALFDDRRGNNNGVVDDFELVSGAGDDIAQVNLDFFGGDRPLLLRINTSCPYRGEVFAFSDGISVSSSIEITVDESAVVVNQ